MDAWGGILWLGCVIALVWCAWWLGKRRHQKREREDTERRAMRHILGSRQWWKQPPGDPPEEDY